jgi:hypothetical protein
MRIAVMAVTLMVSLTMFGCDQPIDNSGDGSVSATLEAEHTATAHVADVVNAIDAGRAAQLLQDTNQNLRAISFLHACRFRRAGSGDSPFDMVIECGRRGFKPYAAYLIDLDDGQLSPFPGSHSQPLLDCSTWQACAALVGDFLRDYDFVPCRAPAGGTSVDTVPPTPTPWKDCYPVPIP